MRNWWTEMWSIGEGPDRTYCGIARTPDGFALDVFRGDTCLASTLHESWSQAEREASTLKRRHRRRRPAAHAAWDSTPQSYGAPARDSRVSAVLHAAQK
jgi:hypothetical protein